MLEVVDLSVSYGRTPALRNVTVTAETGKATIIVGPNGSGKSTLLQAIIRELPATGGTVTFKGRPVVPGSVEANVRLGISLVPEGRHVFATMSVEENLLLAQVVCPDRSVFKQSLERVLTQFPILRERYKGSAGLLSGGEQQQLAIARALVQQPSLLMIDEPSLGLAPLVIDGIYETLAGLRDDGLTLLIVEQSTSRVLSLADKVYALRNGSVVMEQKSEALQDTAMLDALYFEGAA